MFYHVWAQKQNNMQAHVVGVLGWIVMVLAVVEAKLNVLDVDRIAIGHVSGRDAVDLAVRKYDQRTSKSDLEEVTQIDPKNVEIKTEMGSGKYKVVSSGTYSDPQSGQTFQVR